MKRVFLGLGTNIGDKYQNLKNAVIKLNKEFKVNRVSHIYQTPAWGYEEQDDFLNMCIEIMTKTQPIQLLKSLKLIENNLGREKSFRWGPRLIDIDILLYDDIIFSDSKLKIPHPGIAERAFVLKPLNDINPDIKHPTTNITIGKLLEMIDSSMCTRFSKDIKL